MTVSAPALVYNAPMVSPPDSIPRPSAFRRYAPMAAIVVTVAVFLTLGGHRLVSFETLLGEHRNIAAWVAGRPLEAALLYFLGYALMVGCGLPVGTVMIILGGYLFGGLLGAALAVAAAGTGALALFAAARRAGGEFFGRRGGPVVARGREGFQREAVSYMFFLRIAPVFPYFAVTLAAACLGVSTRLFLVASTVGIIPVNAVLATLGSNLDELLDSGRVPGMNDLLEPRFLAPLVLLVALSLLPVLLHRLGFLKA